MTAPGKRTERGHEMWLVCSEVFGMVKILATQGDLGSIPSIQLVITKILFLYCLHAKMLTVLYLELKTRSFITLMMLFNFFNYNCWKL